LYDFCVTAVLSVLDEPGHEQIATRSRRIAAILPTFASFYEFSLLPEGQNRWLVPANFAHFAPGGSPAEMQHEHCLELPEPYLNRRFRQVQLWGLEDRAARPDGGCEAGA
jgi:hypothetical protein